MIKSLLHGCSLLILILTSELAAQEGNLNLNGSNLHSFQPYIILFLLLIIAVILYLYFSKNRQLKKYKSEIEEFKHIEQNSEKLKSDFLTQISHEIRTPVNSILCFSSLIQQELENKLPDELKEGFGIIESGGRRLIRTIDLILNMSEVQAGSFDMKASDFELEKDLILPVIKEFKNLAEAKGLSISLHTSVADSCVVKCDKHMSTQVLIHLIDNAIKYTEKGSIEIILYHNSKKRFCIDIQDTGIGISDEFKKLLFAPFMQEESGYTRKYEGNGLGLALVKKYCDLNKIDVLVKSKKWEGTTITLVF
ncbi:MAG: HAMP domain-containing histidine kinase [Melioribacteraceae bacterium]|nr:HAMP domain-containing histidine kinase [Melioribacteraceae bacterium]